MIINHNIAALNTYNQYSKNSTALSSSLAKLSSGYKINSAADNAAGLAISEKMRGQIRGLDQATSNAQDGISMVQTAEGALSETQSILQRMKELATQAANDTNTTSDRGEIQKEMNQLSSEINRIGNTTEFNTQKLLNGGTQIQTNATASAAALSGGKAAAASLATANGVAGVDAVALKEVTGNLTLTGGKVLDTNTFSYGGVTITMKVAAADGSNFIAGAAKVAGFTGTTAIVNIASANEGDAAEVRDGIIAALNAAKSAGSNAAINNITFSASAVSGITATDTKADGIANNGNFFAGSNAAFANVGTAGQQLAANGGAAGVAGVAATSTMLFTGKSAEGSAIVMADKKIAFWDSTSGSFANAAEAKTALGADFVVDVNGVTDTGAAMSAAVFAAIGANGISGFTMDNSTADMVTLTANTTGVYQGHNRSQVQDVAAPSVAATGAITFSDKPADGSSVTINGQKIGFYDSSAGNYTSDTAAATGMATNFAIDTKGLTTSQVADAVVALQSNIATVTTKDVNLSKTVNTDGSVAVNVTAAATGFGGNTISLDVSKDRTSGFEATFQIGANTAQSMTYEATDMRSQALNITGNVAGATVTAANGSKATYVSTADVSNGTTNTNVEYALDVSTHDKATSAISVLSDAIDSVSAERSKMGAYQNRLEHTISNLTTSSENLTSAESRIRDTDMAKEMTNYQKNNVLLQAAQAMLAQANQQPQSVLKLLQ